MPTALAKARAPHARAVCEHRALLLSGRKRNAQDVQRYEKRWPAVKDPYYSALFSRRKANYRLRKQK